jgi:4-carboxymuconolactone decarboxylase
VNEEAEDLLASIAARRGYLLSYHKVFARLDPAFMHAYDVLYTRSLLEPRFLEQRQRELIWIGIVSLVSESVGEIHLKRARTAGVPLAEVSAAVALAGMTEAWRPIAFAEERWSDYLPQERASLYDRLVTHARGPLDETTSDLILVVLHAVRHQDAPYLHHLRRLLTNGVPETHVAEAVSYLLQPVGANTLLWATDAWIDALKSGRLPESSILGIGDR